MREYAKVAPTFWTGKTGRQIKEAGPEAVVVAFYLMTSPHANMLGLFYCPIAYIANDTGLSLQGASKGLQRAIEARFCAYDAPCEVVWVYEMARYQIEQQLKPGDKRVYGVRREYEKLPKCQFLGDFYDKYKSVFNMEKRRGIEAPSEPLRSQEQEQEQEQEQDIEPSSLRSEGSCPEPKTDGSGLEEPAVDNQVVLTIPLNVKGSEFPITKADIAQWQETFPAVDVLAELREVRQWNLDHPQKRKTRKGIRGHISRWLGKEQDRGRASPPGRSAAGEGIRAHGVKDALILQRDQIARALNDDERRKQQQRTGADPGQASGLLLEHPPS